MAEATLEVCVDAAVHAARPDYVALVLVASGLTNGPSDAESDAQLSAAEAHLRASGLERATDHPHIAAWRAAFSAFGAKPSRYPSSAEALIGRVLKGQALPRVNALVDLYNAISVRHVVPLGGEDADRLEGPLRLTVAAGGEPFDPRGDGIDVEEVPPWEIVWRDDRGVTCRRWNWRQGRRTQLTEDTTRAFFVFDRLEGLTVDKLHHAADELSDLLLDRWPNCRLGRLEPRHMTHHDLIDCVAELLHEDPGELRDAGVTSELNLQGWLAARNLRLVAADPREREVSPAFWIAEHHDGRCVVMFDESPYGASEPVDVSPNELRRALVLVPLDPTRPSGSLPQQAAGAAGVVEALLTAARAEDAIQSHESVELYAGRGIVGDRYFDGMGTFSASEKHGQQLTLIEAEVLDALREDGLHLTPADARRNIVTRGISLNALIGQEFQIGTARCIGRRLCEPCSHLQRLTGAALLRPMVHRGGLRADILTSGVVNVGDDIVAV